MKKVFSSVLAVAFTLSLLAFSPANLNNNDFIEVSEMEVAAFFGCNEFNESLEGFTKCYRISSDSPTLQTELDILEEL